MQKMVTAIYDRYSLRSPTNRVVLISSSFMNECTRKTTREDQEGVYVGAAHIPTYIDPPLAVDVFQWLHEY